MWVFLSWTEGYQACHTKLQTTCEIYSSPLKACLYITSDTVGGSVGLFAFSTERPLMAWWWITCILIAELSKAAPPPHPPVNWCELSLLLSGPSEDSHSSLLFQLFIFMQNTCNRGTKRLLFSFVSDNLMLSPGILCLFSAYLYLNEDCQYLSPWEQEQDNLLSFVVNLLYLIHEGPQETIHHLCQKESTEVQQYLFWILSIPLWLPQEQIYIKTNIFAFINDLQLGRRVSNTQWWI